MSKFVYCDNCDKYVEVQDLGYVFICPKCNEYIEEEENEDA